MSGHAQEVNPPGRHFPEEQDRESARREGVEVKEVGGQQPGGLGVREAPSPGVGLAWRRPEVGSGQDPADGACAEVVSEPD